MKATLHAEVELWQIAAIAEMAIWERRPELQRLCSIVSVGGTLGVGEIDQVLPGFSEAARQNILRHITYLRLIDNRGALTPLGRHCAANGEAPVWEMGGYHFWVSTHPLLRCHVIDFKRGNGNGNGKRQDSKKLELDSAPPWFTPDPAQIWTSAHDKSVKFSLRALPTPPGTNPRCQAEEMQPARLVWNVDLESGQNTWNIEGRLRGDRGAIDFHSPPESVPPEKMAGLFAAWDSRWDKGSGRLAMAYDGGSEKGHDSFVRTLHYPRVQAGEFGHFSDVVVEGVPVGPTGAAEAQQWALALASARIAAADRYCSNDQWAKEWMEVVTGTPLELAAAMAVPTDAIQAIGGNPLSARMRWLFAAASDLSME